MPQMFCTHCKAELKPGVKFCVKCGAPVIQEAEKAASKEGFKKIIKAFLITFLIIPLLSLIVGIVVGVFGKHYGYSLFEYYSNDYTESWFLTYLLSLIFYAASLITIVINLVLTILNANIKKRRFLAAIPLLLCIACPIIIMLSLSGDYGEIVGFVVLVAMSFVSLGSLVLYILTSLFLIGSESKSKEKPD